MGSVASRWMRGNTRADIMTMSALCACNRLPAGSVLVRVVTLGEFLQPLQVRREAAIRVLDDGGDDFAHLPTRRVRIAERDGGLGLVRAERLERHASLGIEIPGAFDALPRND